jgi:hypothetical protein
MTLLRRSLTLLTLSLALWTGVVHAAPPERPYAVVVHDATCQPYEGPAVSFKAGEPIKFIQQVEMYLTCETASGHQFDCSHVRPIDGDFVMDLTEWEEENFTAEEKRGIQCMADALTAPTT